MAVKLWVEPASETTGFCGLTTITRRVAELAVTVSVVEPLTLPSVARIVLGPVPVEVASPFEPVVLLMVATLVLKEVQVTVVVMFCVLESL